jgi:phosphoesterase RecJ-like protein
VTAVPFDRFRAFIDAFDSALITSHVDPDGDAVGSCLGLYHALRGMGKDVVVALESPLPANLRFLPGADAIRSPEAVGRRYRAAWALDCSGLDRAGRVVPVCLEPDAHVANVDHHVGNDGFGDPRLINPEASATAELVHDVLDGYGVPLGPETAQCLYTGILSDTGSFRFQNTTARSLRLAARLAEHGARAADVAEELYMKRSAGSLRILGLALASLEERGGGQIGALTITREMFQRARASADEADGIVQFAKALEGTRVGVLIQEVGPEEIRASLRSDGSVDVNAVAGRFGGGGHRTAAGVRVRGRLEDVRRDLLLAIEQAVNGGPPPPRG